MDQDMAQGDGRWMPLAVVLVGAFFTASVNRGDHANKGDHYGEYGYCDVHPRQSRLRKFCLQCSTAGNRAAALKAPSFLGRPASGYEQADGGEEAGTPHQ